MKLPSLFPVACFAGGILLSGKLASHLHFTPRTLHLGHRIAFLLCAFILLHRQWILHGRDSWSGRVVVSGLAAANLERASVPPNLASTLIETGKLDADCGIALARTFAQRSAAVAVGHAL